MILASLLLMMQAAPPENARAPLGSRIRQSVFSPVQGDPIDPVTVRKMEKKMAHCIVRGGAKLVDALLSSSDRSAIDFDRLDIKPARLQERLSMSACLSAANDDMIATFGFSIGKLRSNLAEEAYLAKHRAPLARNPRWTEVVEERFIVESGQASLARLRGDFSDCVTFHDPEQSDAILRTPVGGPQERAAAQALVPALSACLSEGNKLDLTPAAIRSYAADGLWARSHYQAGPGINAALALSPANEKQD